jgi:hypothetical protein
LVETVSIHGVNMAGHFAERNNPDHFMKMFRLPAVDGVESCRLQAAPAGIALRNWN